AHTPPPYPCPGCIPPQAPQASFPPNSRKREPEDQPRRGGAHRGRNSFRKFDRHTSGEDRQVILPKLLCRLLRPQLEVRLPEPIGARQLKASLEWLVGIDHAPILIFHKGHGETTVHEGPKPFLTLTQRLLCPTPLPLAHG